MKKIDIKKQTNWLKYTKVYFLASAIFIVAGVFAILSWGLPLGLDFTGGAVIDYRVEDNAKIDEIKQKFEEHDIEVEQIQTSEERVSVRTKSLDSEKQQETATISEELSVERVQLQNVGPTIGPELVKKTLYAILIAAGAILMWVAVQFKKWAFGTSAILAMIHDSLILIGSFSILGHFFDAEIDFLFVTAVLTTLSFSVHDTIVVFDRIREITKKHGGELEAVANRAVTETMRRSIINSLTIIIMLLALTIFGGATIRWFTVALLIGAIAGTYSSPFIAIPLYVYLTKLQKRIKKR
jgi:preprotein translocase subunit SecF